MINEQDVKYIVALSRVHLQEKEIPKFAENLKSILDYIDQLKALDTANIEPTSHVLPLNNVEREDVVIPSLEQKDALKIAVEHYEGSFKVPKIMYTGF